MSRLRFGRQRLDFDSVGIEPSAEFGFDGPAGVNRQGLFFDHGTVSLQAQLIGRIENAGPGLDFRKFGRDRVQDGSAGKSRGRVARMAHDPAKDGASDLIGGGTPYFGVLRQPERLQSVSLGRLSGAEDRRRLAI